MIEHIAKLLDGLDVQYVFEEEIVIIPYEDSDYISPSGNSNYIIFIFENPQGILNLVLPEIFVVNDDMPEMFHRLMLSYTDQKVLIKHRISEESNVDLYIQIPLLNQNCSEEQLEFALHTLTTSLTELYHAIQHLDEKGEINLDFLQMDEVPLSTDEDTKEQASSPIEDIDENLLLTKEESLLLKNTGCSIGLFDAILLSENVGSFQQLTPLIDPSLSFQDLKRDSEGIGLFMQLLPIFNTTSLDKLFQYMKERIRELDVSLANKLSDEAKTRFTNFIANAKELDSKNNTPMQNNQSSKSDLKSKELESEGLDSEEVEEKAQQETSDLEISKQEEGNDKEDKGQNKDKPNFDIL